MPVCRLVLLGQAPQRRQRGFQQDREEQRGTFWTLSAWEDTEALYTYAKTEPHRTIMNGPRSTMSGSVFTFWRIPAGDLPVDWADARRRLTEQARANPSNSDGPKTT